MSRGRELIIESVNGIPTVVGSIQPTCKHCGQPIVSQGRVWRHLSAPDHEVWCGDGLSQRVGP